MSRAGSIAASNRALLGLCIHERTQSVAVTDLDDDTVRS